MDYYSGAPEPVAYETNAVSNKGPGFKGFFRKNSFIVLIILALVIAGLLVVFFVYGDSFKPEYEKLSDNSYLKELSVVGGEFEPEFDKKTIKYKLVATSDYITFTCKADHKKAKVEGCDKSIEVVGDKMEFNIKVTAEDTSITRYYFTITREEV